MSLIELFIIAVGLSMDAFAVSICKGLSMQKMSWKMQSLSDSISRLSGGYAAYWLHTDPSLKCHHVHRPLDRIYSSWASSDLI